MCSPEMRLSFEDKERLTYILLRMVVPKLKVCGGRKYAGLINSRIKLFTKIKSKFTLFHYVNFLSDSNFGQIMKIFLTLGGIRFMCEQDQELKQHQDILETVESLSLEHINT